MKTSFFLVLLVLTTGLLSGQEPVNSSNVVIGLFTGLGINQPLPIKGSNNILQPEKYYGRGSYSAGVMFSKRVGKNYGISLAAVYSVHKVGFKYSPLVDPDGGIPTENFEVFNVPVTLKRYLKNNYFLSLGTLIDLDVPRNSQFIGPQTGFGITAGGGKEIRIKNFTLEIAPTLEMHTLLPFQPRETREKLLVLGLRIGLSNYCP